MNNDDLHISREKRKKSNMVETGHETRVVTEFKSNKALWQHKK